MNDRDDRNIIADPWGFLKEFTNGRIALGRTGSSLPTKEFLDFKLCHSKARDAVKLPLDFEDIKRRLDQDCNEYSMILKSRAQDRKEYLKRPDLGRLLSEESEEMVKGVRQKDGFDIALVVADGLSANAIDTNLVPFLRMLLPGLREKGYTMPPVFLVEQGRVAVADDVAEFVGARLAVIFVGERPGLKSPDSMGIYMTYDAKRGSLESSRNCISNIRPEGMSYTAGVSKLKFLIDKSLRLQLSGVNLKDDQENEELADPMVKKIN